MLYLLHNNAHYRLRHMPDIQGGVRRGGGRGGRERVRGYHGMKMGGRERGRRGKRDGRGKEKRAKGRGSFELHQSAWRR